MVGRLDTDYLVVGCGAAGMAFTDSIVAYHDPAMTRLKELLRQA